MQVSQFPLQPNRFALWHVGKKNPDVSAGRVMPVDLFHKYDRRFDIV